MVSAPLIAEAIEILNPRKTLEAGEIQRWAWREACLMMANPRIWRAVHVLGTHLLEHETAPESEVAEIVAAERVRYRTKRFRAQAALLNQCGSISTQE